MSGAQDAQVYEPHGAFRNHTWLHDLTKTASLCMDRDKTLEREAERSHTITFENVEEGGFSLRC